MPTKTYKKKPTSVRTVANKALSLARKAVSAEETKFTDIATTVSSIDSIPDSLLLTGVAQSGTINARIGNKISALGFQLNYYARKHNTAEVTQMRILLVHDTQQVSDSSSLTWNNIFTEESVIAQRNVAAANKRYRIIYDKIHRMDVGNPSIQAVKKYIPFKHPVMFNGTAASDIQKNGVYLMVLSNEILHTATLHYSIRFMYKDA